MTSSTPWRRQAAVGAQAGEWLAVSGAGAWQVEEVGKHQLTRQTGQTGLPPRDLRALGPTMSASYPSSIMGRERPIVVNLEHVRAVITASEVLVPDPCDPAEEGAVCPVEYGKVRRWELRSGGGGYWQMSAAARTSTLRSTVPWKRLPWSRRRFSLMPPMPQRRT
ncbi:hypothetical protein ABZP36_012303 [Zizania latifolia]